MKQISKTLQYRTSGPGLYEITRDVEKVVEESQIGEGILTIFIQHTSASLTVQENADPDVQEDLETFFRRLVSRDIGLYRHGTEGPDDMPAHIRAALTQVSLSIPIDGGTLALGTWQGIYLFEHRDRDHSRSVRLHIIGENA